VNVAIFGATGMIGGGVLLECLDDPRVEHVLLVSRHASGQEHSKIRELLRDDFFEYEPLRPQFQALDACFFCLGVSSVGLSEAEYYRVTFEMTVSAATALLHAAGNRLTFCYVSGEGTDSTEQGRRAWARVKGKTENALLRMPFKAAYMLRPGYIQPLRGLGSKTRWYQVVYDAVGPLYPVLRRLFGTHVTTTVNIGRAMIQLADIGYERPILYSADINRLAALT
jgi:hypothetical protein